MVQEESIGGKLEPTVTLSVFRLLVKKKSVDITFGIVVCDWRGPDGLST